MSAVYRFRLFRPVEAWRDAWVECLPYGRINFRLGFENGMAILSHAMQTDGYPDGDIDVVEIKGRLTQHLESLYRLAEYAVPSVVSPLVFQALNLLIAKDTAWPSIDCKLDLIGRGFVSQGVLTDAGRDAIARYGQPIVRTVEPKSDQPTTISAAAYVGLRYVKMQAWSSVHPATKTALLKREFVDEAGASVTDAGETAIAEYEAVHGARVIPPPEPPKEKRVVLTSGQIEAFQIALKRPYRWPSDVPTRTANVMVEAGWIVIIDDFPKVTKAGAEIYDAQNKKAA